MVLIRLLVLFGLKFNTKIKAKHVLGVDNKYADFLSRGKYKEFRRLSKTDKKPFDSLPTPVPEIFWPMDKLWLKN